MTVQAVDSSSSALPDEARSNFKRASVFRRYPQFTISPAIFVALVAAWSLATDVAGVPAYVLPPPEQVLRAMIGGLSRAPWDRAGYWYHAGITAWEALLGFVIGSALGAFLGLLL
jgi:NitT/TauT family transport system permease protein